MSKEYDAPMHTAEHVLNSVMNRRFGCGRCFSAHVNAKKSKCDYHFDQPFSDADARAVEAEVNAILAEHVDVSEELIPRALAAERFNLERLPESAGDTVRLIHVGSHDSCPCIGEHVSNTREIGQIVLLSHDLESGVLRVRFKRD